MADVAPIRKPPVRNGSPSCRFRTWEDLKNAVSSGNERSYARRNGAARAIRGAEAEHKIAEALHKVHDHNLRAMIGTHDGLEGALTLTEVSRLDRMTKRLSSLC